MIATRAFGTPVQDTTLGCWRDGLTGTGKTICGDPIVSPALVCAPHFDEMRSWGAQPSVPAPEAPSEAALAWLDNLDRDLDLALRGAA